MRTMTIFDNEVSIQMLKGLTHAIIVPILISVLTFSLDPHLTLITGPAYLFFATTIYTLKRNKDIEDEGASWFFYFSLVWILILSMFIATVLTSAMS